MPKNKACRDPLLKRKEAAAYTGYKVASFRVWDSTKRYDLKPIKVAGRIHYRRSVLDQFLEGKLNK